MGMTARATVLGALAIGGALFVAAFIERLAGGPTPVTPDDPLGVSGGPTGSGASVGRYDRREQAGTPPRESRPASEGSGQDLARDYSEAARPKAPGAPDVAWSAAGGRSNGSPRVADAPGAPPDAEPIERVATWLPATGGPTDPLRTKVAAAALRALLWLLREQRSDGGWGGTDDAPDLELTSLAARAVLHAGWSPTANPSIRASAAAERGLRHAFDRRDADWPEGAVAEWLLLADARVSWRPTESTPADQHRTLPVQASEARELVKAAHTGLLAVEGRDAEAPTRRTGAWRDAALVAQALDAAGRLGVQTATEVWGRLLARVLAEQQSDGPRAARELLDTRALAAGHWRVVASATIQDRRRGWDADAPGPTGRALAALIVAWRALKARASRDKAAFAVVAHPRRLAAHAEAENDGFASLGATWPFVVHWSARGSIPFRDREAFATARAIHAAAMESERLNIGRHDWYRDLAERLLARQYDDGAWRPDGTADGAIRATAVALVILHSRLPVPRTAGR